MSCRATAGEWEPGTIRSRDWPPLRRPRRPETCSCWDRESTKGRGRFARAAFPNGQSSGAGKSQARRSSTLRDVPRNDRGRAFPRPAATMSGSRTSTIRNAVYGVVFHDSARVVIRRCHIDHVDYGLTATRDTRATMDDHFIADNLIEGPSTWPRTKGIEDARDPDLGPGA